VGLEGYWSKKASPTKQKPRMDHYRESSRAMFTAAMETGQGEICKGNWHNHPVRALVYLRVQGPRGMRMPPIGPSGLLPSSRWCDWRPDGDALGLPGTRCRANAAVKAASNLYPPPWWKPTTSSTWPKVSQRRISGRRPPAESPPRANSLPIDRQLHCQATVTG